jgi:hypothetical protein
MNITPAGTFSFDNSGYNYEYGFDLPHYYPHYRHHIGSGGLIPTWTCGENNTFIDDIKSVLSCHKSLGVINGDQKASNIMPYSGEIRALGNIDRKFLKLGAIDFPALPAFIYHFYNSDTFTSIPFYQTLNTLTDLSNQQSFRTYLGGTTKKIENNINLYTDISVRSGKSSDVRTIELNNTFTFNIQILSNLGFEVGQKIRISSSISPSTIYLEGTIQSATSMINKTQSITFQATVVAGSGTVSSWIISSLNPDRAASNVEITLAKIFYTLQPYQNGNSRNFAFYDSQKTSSFYNKILHIRVVKKQCPVMGPFSPQQINTCLPQYPNILFWLNTGTFDKPLYVSQTKPWNGTLNWGNMKKLLSYSVSQPKPNYWSNIKDVPWITDYDIEFWGITDPNEYSGLDIEDIILQFPPRNPTKVNIDGITFNLNNYVCSGIKEMKLLTYLLAGQSGPVGLYTSTKVKQTKGFLISPAEIQPSIGYRILPNGTTFVGLAIPGDSNINATFDTTDKIGSSFPNLTPIPPITSPIDSGNTNYWLKGDYNLDKSYNTADKLLSQNLSFNFNINNKYLSNSSKINFTYNMYHGGGEDGKTLSTNTDTNTNISKITNPTGYIYKNWALLRCSLPALIDHQMTELG